METEYDLYLKELLFELEELRKQLQDLLSEKDYEYADFYQKEIWRVENKISIFNSLNSNKYRLDDQKIEDAMVELNQGIIKRFKFILLPDSDFYINFYKREKGSIYCELPTTTELLNARNYVYFPEKIKSIYSLGFTTNSSSDNRLQLKIDITANNYCLGIKTILARLMFDVLQISPSSNAYLSKHYD
ncbi:MAG: hypothetical protein ACO1N7_09380 [Sphingobacteriaceae bacterium]